MIKQNFLTGEYVIYSIDREKRPQTIKKHICPTPVEHCPFCLQNKHMTFKPIYESFNEEIRIVDNKYPIIKQTKDTYGKHYVLIDTKNHEKNIIHFTDEHMFYIMKSIKDMLNILYKDEKLQYVQVFKNKGVNAGASQHHSHWQILGLPIIPNKQNYIINTLKTYEKEQNKCYLCSLKIFDNLVYETTDFLAFCPEDSLYYYEINIMPKKHITSITHLDDTMLKQLGHTLKKVLKKLDIVHNNIDYNICLYNGTKKTKHHFFIQIIPRIGNIAGFEFSTGMFINSCLPQDAAKSLRDAN